MKSLQSFLLPALFIGALVVIAGGIWFYQTLSTPNTSAATETRTGFFGSLFPFGSGDTTTGGSTVGGGNGNINDSPVPSLRRVTENKVAGATFAIGSNKELVLRYVERETGHIYETPVNSWSSVRLTNTTIPAVHSAEWLNASTTVLRLLDEDGKIENFVGFFSSTTPDQSLQGVFIKPYTRIAVGAGGTVIVGVTEGSNGSSVEVADARGSNPKTVLVSQIRSWVPLIGGNAPLLASAPSSGSAGAVYAVADGVLIKLVGDIPGLQALPSPTGTKLLVTGGARRAVAGYIFDIETGVQKVLPRGTLADKCTWGSVGDARILCALPTSLPLANYPDDWLLGRVHTEDELWFIDANAGTLTAAATLTDAAGSALDVSKLVVSSDGSYAAFIDRNTGSLWLAELTPQ